MVEPTKNTFNNEQSLNPCGEIGPLVDNLNQDPPPDLCCPTPTLNYVPKDIDSILTRDFQQKTGIGTQGNNDPMMTGQITNNPPARGQFPAQHTIYRYSKAVRGCDEAMMDLFRRIIVNDEDGKEHVVPIMPGTQERAVAAIFQDNVRKDHTLVVDRIRLPMLAIHQTGMDYDMERYTYSEARRFTSFVDEDSPRSHKLGVSRGIPVNIQYSLYAWALYIEDLNQIEEQILLKMNPVAYINIRGVNWEVIVELNSMGKNIDAEPGDQAIRVCKAQFDMTAKSYIPQPIRKVRTALSINREWVNAVSDEEVTEVLQRVEQTARDLEI